LKIKQEYIEPVNKVIRYIEQTIDKEFSLEDLASVACFSPFHFQRVFKAVMGESPKQYIKRLRLEEAARILTFQPELNILEVALRVGFQSLEAFSRAFKDYYTISPNNYRKLEEIERININQIPYVKNIVENETKIEISLPSKNLEFNDLLIEIVKRPTQKCVYLQTTLQSPQIIKGSFKKIKQWSEAHEIFSDDTIVFGIIKDYPIFTSIEKCRYLTCVSVKTLTKTSGLVSYLEIPSTRYASFNINGGFHEIIKLVSYIVHNWLPQSGYKLKLEPILQFPESDPTITNFNENSYKIFVPVEPE
jgi:AraC family transcriptional regulator